MIWQSRKRSAPITIMVRSGRGTQRVAHVVVRDVEELLDPDGRHRRSLAQQQHATRIGERLRTSSRAQFDVERFAIGLDGAFGQR